MSNLLYTIDSAKIIGYVLISFGVFAFLFMKIIACNTLQIIAFFAETGGIVYL
jgi:hypothetical protein